METVVVTTVELMDLMVLILMQEIFQGGLEGLHLVQVQQELQEHVDLVVQVERLK